ncbi:hypothetical protein [Mitsuokella sp.]|uniref:hypothetical protein n=1 Tax=unclassified Mitsuokella TaxID=2637239 RepID=UPI003D7DF6CD
MKIQNIKKAWKKSMALALAGLMSFGIASTTLTVSAEAASRHEPPRYEQQNNRHDTGDRNWEYQRRDGEQGRYDHNRKPPKKSSSSSHSTGEVTTAAVLGAVVGAVIAKNT